MRNRWRVSKLVFYAQSTTAVISGRWRKGVEWKDKGGGGGGTDRGVLGGGGGGEKQFTT